MSYPAILKLKGKAMILQTRVFLCCCFVFLSFLQLRQILEPDEFFFFNEVINNFSEVQLAATCILSCFGSQAPPIPRQTILWGKLKT